tara:strand:- start:687 stop:917 length:231 start_codon:yes stop_codon:yes gene_type:complete
MTNAWIMKSERCGIVNVYTSKKKALADANIYLADLEDSHWLTLEKYHKEYIQYESKHRLEMSTDRDCIVIERFDLI